MSAIKQVETRVKQVYRTGSDPNVFKGWDYDGQTQNYGYHYQPFNETVIFLGKSKNDALEMLDQIEDAEEL